MQCVPAAVVASQFEWDGQLPSERLKQWMSVYWHLWYVNDITAGSALWILKNSAF
jgi:hypothetical protein